MLGYLRQSKISGFKSQSVKLEPWTLSSKRDVVKLWKLDTKTSKQRRVESADPVIFRVLSKKCSIMYL